MQQFAVTFDINWLFKTHVWNDIAARFLYDSKVFLLISPSELLVAIRDKDSKKLKVALKKVRKAGFGERLSPEVDIAKNLLQRYLVSAFKLCFSLLTRSISWQLRGK